MIDTQEIKALIVKHGYSQKEVAKKMGIADKTMYAKMKNGKFGIDEMNKLIEILSISDPASIFFMKK